MTKTKTVFVCQNCGHSSLKWEGKCSSCGEWNTYVEQTILKKKSGRISERPTKSSSIPINQVEAHYQSRSLTGDKEADRVLGGGMVPGSLILVAGEPGIGKSTLLLQTALRYTSGKILYVSGEESKGQIANRASRIGALHENCFLLTETDPDDIIDQAKEIKPDFIVIDSVQTLNASWIDSSPGSISQIRESAASLMRFAKEENVTLFLIGHITKDGNIAGPKVLEHMVDAVLIFEGDQNHVFRLLRCTKNRFGNTNELGIYKMEGSGLVPIENPSELLLSGYADNLSGSAAAAIIEGIRPLVIEVQALVSTAVYGTPQRSATGYDVRRLNMLLAVLEKRCGFKLGNKDVFLNIAGGLKIQDPSIDLAVVAAILSSSEDLSIPKGTCFAGEVGLSGEIRPVNRIELRVSEAQKLGFESIFISKHHEAGDSLSSKTVLTVPHVRDMLTHMFG
ncbi:MAG: DNA repair protein RadA [Flavobacteriales bacterium]|nr:DNA repair protein RadA [Flavobacteriales bacterium]